ncbi:mas-related G-protein coupled receptor member H-like [Eublepharis macularius]|uniref:Mas-related G-protein coupled receptor member H-like n=1 Tax=Eublepharis macularius TaxID=481883 RepID=A0AA97JRN7_EUBMA|nr:mas-related G-protein coupled receptor member H-like [Eublepharis macularius]
MGASLGYYNHYPRIPNDSINDGHVSEDTSSHNTSDYGSGRTHYNTLEKSALISILVICVFGAVGNGIVIWLLGFRIKRNPFITYILNLAVADFMLLVTPMAVIVIVLSNLARTVFLLSSFLFLSMYSCSQLLLTAISIDRCVAAFFPIWHHCLQPPRLSTIICEVIWILTALLSIIRIIIRITDSKVMNILAFYQFLVSAVFCLPLTTAATVALFIKGCCKAQQQQRGKLLTIILVTLIFFLFLAFPLNVIVILNIYSYVPLYVELLAIALLCLKSSVNPMIYFLVGRQRKAQHRESLKDILQRVFKEEGGCTEELQLRSLDNLNVSPELLRRRQEELCDCFGGTEVAPDEVGIS